MVEIGSNHFSCPVPLALKGRYFLLESENPVILSVVFEHNGYPIVEILHNKPNDNAITEVSVTPPGIITVSDKTTGKFLYKVRPDSETSVVFGKISGGEETIKITDSKIMVGDSSFERNNILGFMVGIMVDDDGRISVGAPVPPYLNGIGPFLR